MASFFIAVLACFIFVLSYNHVRGAEADGHGTHVAGSIGGAQSGTTVGEDDGDGMAFQGQLAVFDFGDSDNSNALTTPDSVCLLCLRRGNMKLIR